MEKTIREIICDGIRSVLSENRKVEEIVLGGEAYQELKRELSSTYLEDLAALEGVFTLEGLAIREFLSYPVKILPYLPPDYIALRIKNGI